MLLGKHISNLSLKETPHIDIPDEAGPRENLDIQDKGVFPIRRIAILGNVCVGKTCLFDHLCAAGEQSTNIPGSTQKVSRGTLSIGPAGAKRSFRHNCDGCSSHATCRNTDEKTRPLATHLYDTPGSATLAANSEDEMVARDLLFSGQMGSVLLVADAKNLRRSLALALEAGEFGLPMVLDLNMVDESESMGLEVDEVVLARELGVPIGRTVARENRGVPGLSELIMEPRVMERSARLPEAVEKGVNRLEEILRNPAIAPRAIGILLLSGDLGAESWVSKHLGEQVLEKAKAIVEEVQGTFNSPLKKVVADAFYAEAERIVDRVVMSSTTSPSLLVRFGALAQRPLPGTLIGLCVLVLAYYWVGVFGATFVVDNLSANLFEKILIPGCDAVVNQIPSAFVRDAIMDPDFGLLPTGLFLAIGIVLPVLFCFYSLQAVLEDSGYLPRLAVLFDRLFRRLGLNGQGLIPLILGFSCIAMAVITTRMLPTRKERNILTLLVVGIPCAPLLAVMIVILDKMPWTAGAVVFGLVGVRILVTGYIAAKVLPGKLPDLILEIPRMRIPRLRILLSKTWRRTWQFMREAVPIFLAASFIVFLIDRVGGLTALENLARPFVHGALGLPDQAVQIFIKTAIRRENGATELEHVRDHFDNVQLVVTMLVMTFVMPCINATVVIVKERGLKACLAILGTTVLSAVATGALVNMICRALGVTFT